MTTTPDPETVRNYALEYLRRYVTNIDHGDVLDEMLTDERFAHLMTGDEDHDIATLDPIAAEITEQAKTLAGALSWPDEQPQDERDAEIARLRADLAEMTGCRDAAMRYAERQHVPIELDDEIDIDGEELASRIEGELLGPGWDWEDDRTPGLLAKQAVAVIRPHLARLTDQAQKAREAQAERDDDVRAVAALLNAQADGASMAECKHAFNDLRARFANEIAALDARDAKAAPTTGWILWDADGRWIGATTSPSENGWRAVSINDAEAQEWQQRGCILDQMDEAGWRAYNEGDKSRWQFEPGSRDVWLAARDMKAGG